MAAWNDQRIELIISTLLRIGVGLAAAVVLAGGICHLARYGSEPANYQAFHGAPKAYRSISGIVGSIGPSNCRAVIQLGILLLIATPIARVAFSLVAFGLEHDRTYVVITTIVLAVLLYSISFEH